jgi:ABC-type dipeptide/oligopeptide/nickel transport system permease subunit
MFGLVTLSLLIFVSVAAPLLTPYSPNELDLRSIRQPPSAAHWLGTDGTGRDVLTRLLYRRPHLPVGGSGFGLHLDGHRRHHRQHLRLCRRQGRHDF